MFEFGTWPHIADEPCSHGLVPNRTDRSIRKADRSEKINFYGTGLRESIFIGPIHGNMVQMYKLEIHGWENTASNYVCAVSALLLLANQNVQIK